MQIRRVLLKWEGKELHNIKLVKEFENPKPKPVFSILCRHHMV